MKVNIGKYPRWIGPYQIAKMLLFWMDEYSDVVYKFGSLLAHDKKGNPSLLNRICEKIYENKSRKINIKIDNYDIWNADCTLSLIIHPILVEFKESIVGCPSVDREDVPEELHNTYDEYGFSHKAWEYALDEMIFSFDPKHCDTLDIEEPISSRINNGRRLFAKYFDGLWS